MHRIYAYSEHIFYCHKEGVYNICKPVTSVGFIWSLSFKHSGATYTLVSHPYWQQTRACDSVYLMLTFGLVLFSFGPVTWTWQSDIGLFPLGYLFTLTSSSVESNLPGGSFCQLVSFTTHRTPPPLTPSGERLSDEVKRVGEGGCQELGSKPSESQRTWAYYLSLSNDTCA